MSQFEKKSVNNGNLAIWLNSLKLGHLQTNRVKRPWGKKTTGYSIPQGKTKSTKTTSSGLVRVTPPAAAGQAGGVVVSLLELRKVIRITCL